jgi:hypothetical protein
VEIPKMIAVAVQKKKQNNLLNPKPKRQWQYLKIMATSEVDSA